MATYLNVELANGRKHVVRMTYLDRIAWEDYAVVRGLPIEDRPVTATAYIAYAALKRLGYVTGEFGQFRQTILDIEETTPGERAAETAGAPAPAVEDDPDDDSRTIAGEPIKWGNPDLPTDDEPLRPTRPAAGDTPR